ncbi:hypothetical protein AYI70_g6318 [Smittium culicis]|uniref:Uncharacterized protein n=1 Tax=Smittium culicis TaxID=133412 RepID=A0A1R1XQH0_9FUNG|nr:hypothetical protein AYI70_g6318 [Smittium culicis]
MEVEIDETSPTSIDSASRNNRSTNLPVPDFCSANFTPLKTPNLQGSQKPSHFPQFPTRNNVYIDTALLTPEKDSNSYEFSNNSSVNYLNRSELKPTNKNSQFKNTFKHKMDMNSTFNLKGYWKSLWKDSFIALLTRLESGLISSRNSSSFNKASNLLANFSVGNKDSNNFSQKNEEKDRKRKIELSALNSTEMDIDTPIKDAPYIAQRSEPSQFKRLKNKRELSSLRLKELGYSEEFFDTSIDHTNLKLHQLEMTHSQQSRQYQLEKTSSQPNTQHQLQVESIRTKMHNVSLDENNLQINPLTTAINSKLQELSFFLKSAKHEHHPNKLKQSHQKNLDTVTFLVEKLGPVIQSLEQVTKNNYSDSPKLDAYLFEHISCELNMSINSLCNSSQNMYTNCSHSASALNRYQLNIVDLNLLLVECIVISCVGLNLIERLDLFISQTKYKYSNIQTKISLFKLSSLVVEWVSGNYSDPNIEFSRANQQNLRSSPGNSSKHMNPSGHYKKIRLVDIKFMQSFELLVRIIKSTSTLLSNININNINNNHNSELKASIKHLVYSVNLCSHYFLSTILYIHSHHLQHDLLESQTAPSTSIKQQAELFVLFLKVLITLLQTLFETFSDLDFENLQASFTRPSNFSSEFSRLLRLFHYSESLLE